LREIGHKAAPKRGVDAPPELNESGQRPLPGGVGLLPAFWSYDNAGSGAMEQRNFQKPGSLAALTHVLPIAGLL
jgi:hypothetical protein